jgi:hypothetical protein
MTPFNVHVCAKATSASAALTKMNGVPFLMERKVDGERYVLHKKGNDLRFWSRQLKVSSSVSPLLPFLPLSFPLIVADSPFPAQRTFNGISVSLILFLLPSLPPSLPPSLARPARVLHRAD